MYPINILDPSNVLGLKKFGFLKTLCSQKKFFNLKYIKKANKAWEELDKMKSGFGVLLAIKTNLILVLS